MSRPDDRAFLDLVRRLAAHVPARTPAWTDANQPDPGRTLVELLGYLVDELTARTNILSTADRQRLADIGERLAALADPGAAEPRGRGPLRSGRHPRPGKLQDEQERARHPLRRLNLGPQGVGMASGLQVRIEPGSQEGAQRVVLTPGFAITPGGREINLREPLSCDVPGDNDARFVTLWYVEHDVDPLPLAGDLDLASTPLIEEGFALTLERSQDSGGLVLAHLTHEGSEWRVTPEAGG